jgi:RecA-family ATPase
MQPSGPLNLDDMEALEEAEARVVPIGPPEWMDEATEALFRQEGATRDEHATERQPLNLIDPSSWQDMEPPERRWSVDGYIPHGQATLLTGAGSAGKSLVTQQMCTCIAMGLPWLGVPVEQATAIYISCEDDTDELWRRQKAIADGLGVSLTDLSGRLFLLSLAGQIDNELATFSDRGQLSVAERYQDIEEAALTHGARFVALDNTGHFYSGNENDRHQVASFVNLCNGMAAKIDGSVIILGHPNKAGAEYSGSTAWENQVRSRLFMETPQNDDGTFTNPDMRMISRGKANYAQKGDGLRFVWHKWTFKLPDEVPERDQIDASIGHENLIFLKCLAERNRQRRAVSERRGPNYAPAVFDKMAESKGIGKAKLDAAMDRLYRLGTIGREFLWRDTGEGRDIFGLRELSANGSVDPQTHRKHGSQTHRKPTANTRNHSLYNSTSYKGGPPETAPPSEEMTEDWRDNPILNGGKEND